MSKPELNPPSKPKLVDEYEISVSEGPFAHLVLAFKCDDGSIERYMFPPLYAHKLADELTMASVRAAAK